MKTLAPLKTVLMILLVCVPAIICAGCGGSSAAVQTAPEDDPTLQADDSTKNTGKPDRSLDPTLGG